MHEKKIKHVLNRMEEAAISAQRPADAVTLVAVSKTKPIADIIAAYDAGLRHFGENRTEALEEKAKALQHLSDIKWHFIGHLQTRQSKRVAEYADYFHALDRLKVARRLSHQLQTLERVLPVFIEVNISGEESKAGFACADWEDDPQQRHAFLEAAKTIAALPHLELRGLMTMAPFKAPEDFIRTVFQRLHQLSKWLNQELPDLNAHALSMGMSGDFEIAIEEGATHVRVGTSIFGKRDQ